MAVSESLSSVSDTIFNLDIIHRTDMQGNISARKQAEEKLQLYASVFSHAREGITITDIEGTILDIAMWRDLIETGHWSNEIWNKRKSGEVYPQLLTISVVPDAQGIVWIRWHASMDCRVACAPRSDESCQLPRAKRGNPGSPGGMDCRKLRDTRLVAGAP